MSKKSIYELSSAVKISNDGEPWLHPPASSTLNANPSVILSHVCLIFLLIFLLYFIIEKLKNSGQFFISILEFRIVPDYSQKLLSFE